MTEILEDVADGIDKEKVKQTLTSKYFIGVFLIAAFALYIRFANSFFTGLWIDEGRYARLGKEVSAHLLSYSASVPQWNEQIVQFPPVYPYLIAISNYFFSSSEMAARVVSPIVSTFGVVIGYLLGRDMKNRTAGLIFAALVAVNPVYWFLSTRVLIGATLTVVYSLAVYLLFYGMEENRKYSDYAFWMLGPVLAIAIMTKQPAFSLGIIVPAYLVYRKYDEIHEVLMTDTTFSESRLKQTLTERKYYISAGLGLLVLMPWMLRNMAVCSFPLCGVQRALNFAVSGGLDVQGDFYFIKTLPQVITLPATLLVAGAVIKNIGNRAFENPDFLVKYFVATGVLTLLAFSFRQDLIPMIVLMSFAALAKNDAEKLLWLWIGAGIGFMSVPGTKVPRYIVFTVPALTGIAAFLIYDISSWISETLEFEQFGTQEIALIAAVPFVAIAFLQGTGMVTGHSFQHVETSGEWIDQNTPTDANIAASSDQSVQFFVHPRTAEMPRMDNMTDFVPWLKERNISYVQVDVYERTQPEWMMTKIPPWKLPNSVIRQLQQGSLSAQQAFSEFEQAPSYLEPVQTFGQTRVPLIRNQTQPQAMVYEVNRSALP